MLAGKMPTVLGGWAACNGSQKGRGGIGGGAGRLAAGTENSSFLKAALTSASLPGEAKPQQGEACNRVPALGGVESPGVCTMAGERRSKRDVGCVFSPSAYLSLLEVAPLPRFAVEHPVDLLAALAVLYQLLALSNRGEASRPQPPPSESTERVLPGVAESNSEWLRQAS
mmetsp:Transcript_90163/g.162615  ORF Transcript_90163/g.162615 Transcript_90163/m.162615 type:complete len:170 (+) Transcript_90163:548-1057(+)